MDEESDLEPDFSWSGDPADLELPDGLPFEAIKRATHIVHDYERYTVDLDIPTGKRGDGDCDIMLVYRIWSALASEHEPRC